MCGRFALAATSEDFMALLPGLKIEIWPEPRYNIAPQQNILTILHDGSLRATLTRWGLIPSWARDPSLGNRMINARSETIRDKASFKKPFRRQRCLIPVSGFYEWQTLPGLKHKIPYYIKMRSGNPFAFAGLWDLWRGAGGGEVLTSTIITTGPNKIMASIHNRMPVILPPSAYETWLKAGETDEEMLISLLKPYPAEEMEAVKVTAAVNNPSNDSPDCIHPATMS